MKIKVNGQNKEIKDNISINQLILDLHLVKKKVAVELNGEVETDFSKILNEGDEVEIVYFVGGG